MRLISELGRMLTLAGYPSQRNLLLVVIHHGWRCVYNGHLELRD